jgi:hypothetical protein
MSGRSFEFYNNLGRFNFKITTQKSGRWNKPVIVITVVTAKTRAIKNFTARGHNILNYALKTSP